MTKLKDDITHDTINKVPVLYIQYGKMKLCGDMVKVSSQKNMEFKKYAESK